MVETIKIVIEMAVDMDYKHSHPINILEYTSKFLVLLVFPIIRALLLSEMGLYAWLKGAWFDILTILAIVALGLIAWWRYLYCFANDGIYLKKGLWIVKERFIPYEKLAVVSIEYPFYFIPIHAVRLSADTDGGLPTVSDFKITIYKKKLEEIAYKVTNPFINPVEIKRVYLPKNRYIAILSLVVSNTLTGVLFVATFISGLGKVLGKEIEKQVVAHLTTLASILAFGIPPAAAILAFTILGGWVVSFAVNLIRHLKFSVTRQSGTLSIMSGLVSRRRYLITVSRINLVELRQSLFTKAFGIYTAFIHCNGYGKTKDELSILMPAGRRYDVRHNIAMLLPEIQICKPTLRPRKSYLSRFLFLPIVLSIIVFVGWMLAYVVFPQFYSVISYVGLMAEIPCIWYLLVRIFSYFHTGVGLANEVYTFTFTHGYRFKTIAVPQKRIVKVQIRRNVFHRMSGCCDLVVDTVSEGRKRHIIPNLNYKDTKKMMNVLFS